MADGITRADVARIAHLARLALTPAEAEEMQRSLSQILAYVKKLDELDTREVAPTAHAVDLPSARRADVVTPSLPVERALQNAPERLGDGFGVPKIVD